MALSEKQVLFCLKPSRIYSTFLLRLGTAPTITMSFIHVPQPPHDFWISCLNWTIMLNYRGHYYSSIFLTASSYLVMDTAARIRSEIIALVLPSSWIFNGSPLLTWKLNLWSKNTVLKMPGQDIGWVGKTVDLRLGDLDLNPGSATSLTPVSSFSFVLQI